MEDFLEKVQIDFPILFDPDGTTTRRWKVYGLPTSFLIDKAGKVRYALTGPTEWDGEEAMGLIEGLLR
jgi:peroxiredoxin